MTFVKNLLLFLLLLGVTNKVFSAPINEQTENLRNEDQLNIAEDKEDSTEEDSAEESGDVDTEGSGVVSELSKEKDEEKRQYITPRNKIAVHKTKQDKNAKKRGCGKRGCGDDDDEGDRDEDNHHEKGEEMHHHHHHGHHEHEHEHHHHGHHHGFIHEWGQEEGGEHHGHEGHGHHEHCNEHEHEHEHEEHQGHEGGHHEEDCEGCEGGGGGGGGGGWLVNKKFSEKVASRRQNIYDKFPLAYHCRDIVSTSGKVSPTKRFCVPLVRRAAIAWADFSLPSNKNKQKNTRTKKRNTLERAVKKQTVHIGYGYASGDNYRLGYQLGGMGGLESSFSGAVLPNKNFGAREPNKKSIISSGIKRNGVGKRTDLGFEPPVNNAGGSSTPYGHPVTHPGFTTMGYPGQAMASADVRNKIIQPFYKSTKSIYDRQPVFIEDYQLDNRNQHFETLPRYVSVLAE
ncbi:uncharacterized protein LOC101239391 isoform X2 [Hydra vulgaris]|uniref:uncharacterized protein LOC101239391 isoform X2 n=1 Tax=Hydra vulgaris TaxID=6087 RepID=UPI001F5E3C9C|nr:homeobox-leucine zipper protein HOX21 isoform X2 [Hydra vulgaris]